MRQWRGNSARAASGGFGAGRGPRAVGSYQMVCASGRTHALPTTCVEAGEHSADPLSEGIMEDCGVGEWVQECF